MGCEGGVMASVVCSGVEKVYGAGAVAVRALRGVDWEVGAGEFVALVGPSGSGKTTLLNLIGCLDRPSSGTVVVDGVEVSSLSKAGAADLRRDRIGFVFQSFNLIPVLTAYENVAFPLVLQGRPSREIRERVLAMLAEVGLEGLGDRRPAELSAGQQQRVAVARALVKRPALVLADEPTANLDSENGGKVVALMAELNRRHGVTFILSTHDRMVVEQARRVVTLRDGRIVADERRAG